MSGKARIGYAADRGTIAASVAFAGRPFPGSRPEFDPTGSYADAVRGVEAVAVRLYFWAKSEAISAIDL
jgi:hypothetical protein